MDIDQSILDSLNVAQGRSENKKNLTNIGGIDALISRIGVNITTGLTHDQVTFNRNKLGDNRMPESPKTGFLTLFFRALSDTTLIILILAACVSFGIGYWQDPATGWIEGAAIFVAVFLVANISAGNDYSKELQFRALEASSQVSPVLVLMGINVIIGGYSIL